MANYPKAFARLIINEGGYTINPNETYKGVDRKFWPNWEGWPIIDSYKAKPNFPFTLEVNETLQSMINTFYKENFWDKVMGEYIINQDVAFSIFDFAVNAGHSTSIQLAQKAVGANVDGIMGKQTLGLINSTDKELFLAKFALAKIAKYVKIIDSDKSKVEFFFGWVKRVINN